MSTWEETLSQAGCRITAPRRAVMQVLAQTEWPLVPQEILALGVKLHATLSLVTVYRTLELFEELSLVRRVHQDDKCQGYLLTAAGHRHVLICEKCGRAVEFPGQDDLTALIARVEKETGYLIAAHWLQLRGVCPTCR
ncbi:MAG: Fur family transcriptional regulator [Chloroflexota bacterium]|nr:Fur family transcriptional regulator [Chloroflexota bacterium]